MTDNTINNNSNQEIINEHHDDAENNNMMKDEEMNQNNNCIDEQQQEQQQQQQEQQDEIIDDDIPEDYMIREKEFFEFHPLSFIDDIHESAHDYCAEIADKTERYILGHIISNSPSNIQYKETIAESTDQLWNILQ